MKKRLFASALCLCMLLTLLPTTAQAFMLSTENELLTYSSFDLGNTGQNLDHITMRWSDIDADGYYNDRKGYAAYMQAVAFDPNGTGRDDHVAFVGSCRWQF